MPSIPRVATIHRLAWAAAGALTALPAAAQSEAAAPGPEAAPQVVEVTASKRKERLQDAPTALTVIDAAALERLGIERVADYVVLVPGLSQASAAGSGLSALILRGMYTGVQQQTATTVTYFGETPFTASGGLSLSALTTPDPDLVDIERIEVLKGPQGTLYGAGSLGGLVRLIPQRADLRSLSGLVRLGASQVADGGSGHGVRASLNVPLSTDRLGLLVHAFDRTDPGFTRNVLTGQDELGRTRARGGSLTARFKPERTIELNLRLLTQRADTRGATGQDNLAGTGTPTYGARQYGATFDRGVSSRYRLGELSAEFALAGGTLTATLGRAHIEVGAREDYTAAYAPLVVFLTDARTVFGVPLNTPPFVPASVRGNVMPRVDKTSAELRFASRRLGALELLAGLFATREDNLYPTETLQYDATGRLYTGQVLGFDATSPTLTRLFDRGVLTRTRLESRYDEAALFGQATVHFDPRWDATLGLRHANHRQRADAVSPAPGVGFINIGNYRIRSEDSANTYLAALRYRPDADTSTFLRVASGYRPGGTQATPALPPTYAPDTVVNVELGVKGRAGALRYDASVYHTDWDRVQLNSLTNGVPVLRNGGRAKVDGVEAQWSYRSQGGVMLGGQLGFNRARLVALDAETAAATGARPGDALPNSPKLSAAFFVDRTLALGGRTLDIGATLRYTGTKQANYSADPLNLPYTVPAFTTLDLRASLQWADCTLRLGVDNATDRNGISGYTTLQVLPGTVQSSTVWLIRPRTLTATLARSF